jgi:hypothetical protein
MLGSGHVLAHAYTEARARDLRLRDDSLSLEGSARSGGPSKRSSCRTNPKSPWSSEDEPDGIRWTSSPRVDEGVPVRLFSHVGLIERFLLLCPYPTRRLAHRLEVDGDLS